MSRTLLSTLCVMPLALLACSAGGGLVVAAPADQPAQTRAGDRPLLGGRAPDFSLARVDQAGTIHLADLRGKVVLVDFWATWNGPCAKSFPKYQELYVKYKDKLEIVGLSMDEEKDGIAAFGKTYGATFPLGWDEGKTVARQYVPPNMPTAFLVDKTGIVRFVHFGYQDGDEKQIEEELNKLF